MSARILEQLRIHDFVELNAINRAVFAGNKLNEIVVHTVKTGTGQALNHFRNCRITKALLKTTSDQS